MQPSVHRRLRAGPRRRTGFPSFGRPGWRQEPRAAWRSRPDESCIRLSTNHQSKCLEYPHVFIIGLADGLFPNKRAIDGESELEEERRLFYVASTQAERSLYLLYPTLANQKGTPVRLMQSRFIKELPDSKYEIHNAHSHRGFGRERSYGQSGWSRYGRGY